MPFEYPPQDAVDPPVTPPITCRAVYENGVFRPLGFMTVPEGEEVTIAWKREPRPAWIDRPVPPMEPEGSGPPDSDPPAHLPLLTAEQIGIHPDYLGLISLLDGPAGVPVGGGADVTDRMGTGRCRKRSPVRRVRR